MSRFNLSEWSLSHRGLVLYLMVMLTAVGVFAYQGLGQSEDPPFTFKVMVVRTLWPGATAREVELVKAEVAQSGEAAYAGIVWALFNTQQFRFVQ